MLADCSKDGVQRRRIKARSPAVDSSDLRRLRMTSLLDDADRSRVLEARWTINRKWLVANQSESNGHVIVDIVRP